jgi:hypothetical protein
MTRGHCDSCRWRWVPWAGPCKHPAPAEGQECIGFSPDKSHFRRKREEEVPSGGLFFLWPAEITIVI